MCGLREWRQLDEACPSIIDNILSCTYKFFVLRCPEWVIQIMPTPLVNTKLPSVHTQMRQGLTILPVYSTLIAGSSRNVVSATPWISAEDLLQFRSHSKR